MKILWSEGEAPKTYKTYQNAVRAAEKEIGEDAIRVVIVATPEGRFFPVALGEAAMQAGYHFRMCVAN